MKGRRLLVVPLLLPLVAVLLVAALNPRPQVSFRVLTWVTPRAPLGLWLAAAALGGAALSGAGTALALGQGSGLQTRRRVASRPAEPWNESWSTDGPWGRHDTAPRGERQRGRTDPLGTSAPNVANEAASPGRVRAVPPPRAPGDPAPTVDAPFRVLRRPAHAAAEDSGSFADAGAQIRTTGQTEVVSEAIPEDWGDGSASEDW